MPDFANHDPAGSPPLALDAALRAIPDPPLPDGLLASCLATVPRTSDARSGRRRRRAFKVVRLAAAALLLFAAIGYLTRSRHVDAAEMLQAAKAAWSKAPASHQVVHTTVNNTVRTEETWALRHWGIRKEARVGGNLISLVVRNARWEFRWDVPGRTVAVWSTELAAAHLRPGDEGLVLDAKGLEAWARDHRAEIVVEPDTIAGRKAQKVVLQWPSPAGATGRQQTTTVWFDPRSMLPVKQVFNGPDGMVVETTIDYPAADAVPADLFTFVMPRDVVLEVNDPELGRQLYSESQAGKANAAPTAQSKGAEQ